MLLMKNLVFSILLLILVTPWTYAQKALNSGTIKMSITEVKSDDPQVEAQMQMMVGSETELVFDGEEHVTNMSMMGGMINIKNYVNNAEKKMDMLMDMMGQKLWVETTLDQAQSPQERQVAEMSKISYDKNDRKTILGYSCYKMTLTNPEMEGMQIIAYVSEDIKTKANNLQGFQSLTFSGYPLEYTMSSPQFSLTMTTTEIKDAVDKSRLKLNTTGYKKMSMEEFQKSMGGGGFGF